jgi:hypothetical protein
MKADGNLARRHRLKRLSLQLDLPPALGRALVPRLILQPLVAQAQMLDVAVHLREAQLPLERNLLSGRAMEV